MYFRCICLVLITINFMDCLTIIDSDPPDPSERALMARYVIHLSDWMSLSTISTLKSIKSYPFVNLKSISDGPVYQSTGIPYMFMTSLDLSGNDLNYDSRCTALASLAESNYCKNQSLDPQDPRCARVILSGRFVKVGNLTEEHKFAEKALFARHPSMKDWPIGHHFYIGKLELDLILVLDNFGGAKEVSIIDYFNANVTLLNYLIKNI